MSDKEDYIKYFAGAHFSGKTNARVVHDFINDEDLRYQAFKARLLDELNLKCEWCGKGSTAQDKEQP